MLFLNQDALQRGAKAHSLHGQKIHNEFPDKKIVMLSGLFNPTLFHDEDRLMFLSILCFCMLKSFLKYMILELWRDLSGIGLLTGGKKYIMLCKSCTLRELLDLIHASCPRNNGRLCGAQLRKYIEL